MARLCLTDHQWSLIEPHCLGKKSDPGRSGTDNRMFIEGILWVARTGSPWRDLPPEFGKWNTAFRRYRDWVKADVFARIFEALWPAAGLMDTKIRCFIELEVHHGTKEVYARV